MDLIDTTLGITGGNSGLGLAIVKLFAMYCKKIIVIDKSNICQELENIYNVEYIQCDLLKDKFEPFEVDIFISNVGMSLGPKLIKDTSYEEIENMLNINVLSHIWCFKKIKWKKFVFIDSVLSYIGIEKYATYCASKSAIKAFNESAQREGYDTLIVYPYKLNTSMFREIKDFCTLDVNYVAKEIKNCIEKDRKSITLPRILILVDVFKGMVLDFLKNLALNWVASYYLEDKMIKDTEETLSVLEEDLELVDEFDDAPDYNDDQAFIKASDEFIEKEVLATQN